MPPKIDFTQIYRAFKVQRSRLDNLDAEVAAYDPETHSEEYLRYRERVLKFLEDGYKEIVERMLADPDEDVFDEILERIRDFDTALGAANVRLSTQLKTIETPVPQPNPVPKQHSRLPPLPVPTFSGQVTDWVYFKDEFAKLIGQSTELDPVEKLHYLRKSLEGDAATVQSTNDTFDSLWAALNKKYDVKRLIVERHLGELLSLPPMTKECPRQLEALLSKVLKNVRVLESLELEQNDLSKQFIINIVTSRLDPDTKKAFGMRLKPTELADYEEMFEFLQGRCQTLESLEEGKQTPTNKLSVSRSTPRNSGGYTRASNPNGRNTVLHTSEKKKSDCLLCGKGHFITNCKEFVAMTPRERLNQVQRWKLCCNCLSTQHITKDCSSKYSCKICTKRHNILLHLDNRDRSPTPSTSSGRGGSKDVDKNKTTLTSLFSSKKEILLGTAVVLIYDARGQPTFCRALLDSCSQPNIITENCAQRLGLKRVPVRAVVLGLEGKPSGCKSRLSARVASRFTDYSVELNFVVMSKITGHHPDFRINTEDWDMPVNKQLADPDFDKPQKVDLILGAEIFYEILTGGFIKLAANAPTLCATEFGWIVGGRVDRAPAERRNNAEFCGCIMTQDDALYDQMKKFWEIENCGASTVLSVQEREVEKHFVETHYRQPDGRYVVALPTKPNVNELGDSKRAAERRFLNVERRLARDPSLKQQYVAFMTEYQQLGHMEPSDTNQKRPEYFLPHHAVLKPDSSTTKLRVVFDGSAKSSTGLALNDVIKVGATVQQELFEILVRFRKHQVAFTADIGKMYRQVRVNEQHQPLQQIMWRNDPSEKLIAYSLKTVTYGTSSAPFLATRALQQLADDEQADFPIAAPIAKLDFYVDDVLSGADTIHDAMELQQQLIEMLKRGGFELHKWCANTPDLLSNVPADRQEKKLLSDSQTVKALGIEWQPTRDIFAITTTPIATTVRAATKRTVLSDIARLFDPLGIAGPIIVTTKILLQRLWQKQADWDDPLDSDDERAWEVFRDELKNLKQVNVPRCVIPFGQIQSIILHGFCDASTAAYGACVYVQCIDSTGNKCANLLCSKSRVAPLKTITVPRLELCSAQLLAQLVQKVKHAMNIQFTKTFYWSDSTIVLAWLRSQSNNLKTFVAHRIAEIQDTSNPNDWRHVPTEQNPADIISRGLQPSQLKDCELWWHGPAFLTEPEDRWPTQMVKVDPSSVPELKTCLVVHEVKPFFVLSKFSSFLRLQRVMAYVVRFAANCRKRKEERQLLHLNAQEMTKSLKTILRTVQIEGFTADYKNLSKGKPIEKDSPLFKLNAFQDKEQLIRVGGRIRHSEQSFDVKHQIALPKHHHVTKILIRDLHERNGHVGQQGLLAIVRQSYWPVGAKDVIKSVTKNCVLCFKHKPKPIEQAMGDLPAVRTTACHPFINVGVDYAGPLQIKLTRRTTAKAYVAIFVCMATKAVHIELVSDLTSKAFIAALTRFTSRRGHCQNIYSDNGTNFVGARSELKQLYEFLSMQNTREQIATASAINRIDFHFVPPRAPHFGGLWEAAVKSTKRHLYRIVGPLKLTFEELSTVLAKVESILNSRPLIPESSDPEDVAALTPGHLLIGRPLVSMVEPNYSDVPSNKLNRWQLLQKATQHFWQRWSAEYLTALQQRARMYAKVEIKFGMLVLIKEDNIPPTQ